MAEAAAPAGRTENARLTQSTGKDIASGNLGGDFKFQENPAFIEHRLSVYERVKALRAVEDEAQPRQPIEIVLPDGTVKPGVSFTTSPLDIALSISEGLANSIVIAKVFYSSRVGSAADVTDSSGFDDAGLEEEQVVTINKGELWDLSRPLEGSCKLELLKFDEPEAKMVFWHSSAHVLGECMECKLGSHLTVGPPVEAGFYYDCYMGKSSITEDIKTKLGKEALVVAKQKQKFERIVLTKEEALEMFKDNPFKVAIISSKIKDGSRTTAYRCGPLIDLCMGPHITHTGKIKAFELTKYSAAYWLGDAKNDSLQRVYGISFPDKKMMKEYKAMVALAEENDHRKRGAEQQLFFFHKMSAGSAFFLPHGTRIYNRLMDWIKSEYWKRGYEEVITPNIFNVDLWKTSGHWEHYKDDMFSLKEGDAAVPAAIVDGSSADDANAMATAGSTEEAAIQYALKPMNCPGHCLLFAHAAKSYRELPMRVADFGVLHRNEASGALTGLTRVRRFCQDDAHIFCRKDQIRDEVIGALNFMKDVYGTLGMTFKLERSTRPAKAIGIDTPEGVAMWDYAEDELTAALDQFVGKGEWRDNPGDGAFYGPKIDIKVFDAMKRKHQCATVQLDFQLPSRFGLEYNGEDGIEKPVMIHRAMLGSLERFIGVLTEHFAGKWPFWLSPRQIIIVAVHQDWYEYAEEVRATLHNAGYYVDVDTSSKTMKKKIALANDARYNFTLVVGEDEVNKKTVNVRNLIPEIKVADLLTFFKTLTDNKLNNDKVRETGAALGHTMAVEAVAHVAAAAAPAKGAGKKQKVKKAQPTEAEAAVIKAAYLAKKAAAAAKEE